MNALANLAAKKAAFDANGHDPRTEGFAHAAIELARAVGDILDPIERTLSNIPKGEPGPSDDQYRPDSDSLVDRLRNVLRDANGLQPTYSAAEVLFDVYLATEHVDENWSHAGQASSRDYAAAAIERLRRRFDL